MSEFNTGLPSISAESAEKIEAKQKMAEALKVGRMKAARELADEHGISPEDFITAVKAGLIDQVTKLRLADLDDMFELLGQESLDEFLRSPEAQEAAKQGILNGLQSNKADAVVQIIADWKVPADVLRTDAFLLPSRVCALGMLKAGSLVGMNKIAKAFEISSEFFESDEAKGNAKDGAAKLRSLSRPREDLAAAIEKEFGLI